jgi:catechol 2,3-dioxygenase-like lactoylglutathione lyase family enzyme
MSRGLDHIVHAVRDLDAAAAFYRLLGFTVGARNSHPWGTHNHIVQLPGFFVELLTVADPDKLGEDGFSALFGTFNRIFLKSHEGLSFLMLESQDADADARDFGAAGIAVSSALQFEREGVRPDGSKRKVGFSLAFARDAGAPAIGFATCRQHNPENFWNPSLQQHPNGASGIASAVIVAENPSDHHIFLSAFTGERELHATSNGITAATPRGDLAIMDAAAFRSHFGVPPPDLAGGARLAAIWFTVREREALIAALDAGAVPHIAHMGRVVVAPEAAMGATLVFGMQGNFAPG